MVELFWRIRFRSSRYSAFGAIRPRHLNGSLRRSRQLEHQSKVGKAGSWKFVENLEGMILDLATTWHKNRYGEAPIALLLVSFFK